MDEIILLKEGEIILKGQNRREFEKKLIENLKRRLKPIGDFRVSVFKSAIYVEPQGKSSCADVLSTALAATKTVFGIATITIAKPCEKDKDVISLTAEAYLKDALKNAKTFKVESRRSDKSFPMKSPELSKYVGGKLHEKYPHLTADMQYPDLCITVEIRENAAYIHGKPERGAGGLPVGTSGKMVALLSGGIDSPVAMYLMAKRGARLTPIHFHSPPYTSEQAKQKVETLTKTLEKYCGTLRVEFVNLTKIQEEIRKNCPEAYLTVLTRRAMVRIAERIARSKGCTALVTGDNLGQVASQTMEAMAVTQQITGLPIFRPLIAFDKEEIIALAKKIGTYETSILPFEDCCTLFTPSRPRTKPKLTDVLAAEASLDIEGLISKELISKP